MMKKLSIIIPTYNERDNVPILAQKISHVLAGIDYEIIVVDDDSADKTWEVVEELHHRDKRISGIRRIGRKGLSSAVIEGVVGSDAQFVAVIDADLQHDEILLALMLKAGEAGADVVIGSRYLTTEGAGDWDKKRLLMSRMATWVTLKIVRHKLSDPLSGFFLMRRRVFVDCIPKLVGQGFKILLDVLSNYRSGSIVIKELPYTFKVRQHGKSKMSAATVVELFKFFLIKSCFRGRVN